MIDIESLKEMTNQFEIPELLPKAFTPKHRYVEICRGIGIEYTERVVPEHQVKTEIMNGWSITRLSKLSTEYVHAKWINAIIAMEAHNV